MLSLLLRRARAQWSLLLSLLAVLTVGATFLGTCALLVTRTSDRAFEVAVRDDPEAAEVVAYTATIAAGDAASVAVDTRRVLVSAVAPFEVTTAARASSVMRALPGGGDREAYLSGIEDLDSRASLVSGGWPRKGQAAVLESTARLLGLSVGSRVTLGEELGVGGAPPVTVTVSGIVRPLPGGGWDRDPLRGKGFDADPPNATSARKVQAYGPFIVGLDALLTSGSAIERLEIVAHPDLSAPNTRDLNAIASTLGEADRRLSGALADRVQIERVSSPLPQTLADARAQQRLTTAAVLALTLIGVLLTAIALTLAGRLAASSRTEEASLLSAMGTGRGQFAVVAAAEALALAGLAALLSIPASSALHSLLTRVPPLSAAGLTTGPAVTLAQLLAVGAGVLLLAILLVGLAIRPAAAVGDRRGRRELLARSGADVLLAALAAVGWWQLRAQPPDAGSRADVVRVVAPALLLTAGAALALRLLPPVLRYAERLADRSRGLVLPLAVVQAARRRQAFAAGLLIALGCGAATFGLAYDATWRASQHDQADVAVGTDAVVTLDGPATPGQGAAVAAAAGGTVSPVTRGPVVIGQSAGGPTAVPQLLALDLTHARELLRGRATVSAGLAPGSRADGLAVPAKAVPALAGRGPLPVVPRLVFEDGTGLRTACTGPETPLDGRAHRLAGCAPAAAARLVAVALQPVGVADEAEGAVEATLTVPGATGPSSWTAHQAAQLASPAVTVTGDRVRLRAVVQFADPYDGARQLVASSFPDPREVPVAVSQRLADDLHAGPGSTLSLSYGNTPVPARVTEVIPTVPSAPGAPAVLADLDLLSRALISHGDLESPVTAWWIGDPARTSTLEALGLGPVTTRAGEAARLTGSPVRAAQPAAMRLLVAAAVVLLLGGVLLHVASDLRDRALEVARLRGLGVSRREIRAALFGEHAGVILPLLLCGAAVGALATWGVAPLMIRSDTGAQPVPAAAAHWPWGREALLLGFLTVAAGIVVTVTVAVQARRADAAHLRVAS
ncbi:permease [Actinoplanes sp. NPDC048988]|uniref:permease n=1 Tax=Actinoplanes sp. NPDC048988 TaxID=3363901 RepID=UPI0037123F09